MLKRNCSSLGPQVVKKAYIEESKRPEVSKESKDTKDTKETRDEPNWTTLVLHTSVVNTFDLRNSYSFTNVYKVPWSLIEGTIAEDILEKSNGCVSVDASCLNMATTKDLDMYRWLEETTDGNVEILFSSDWDQRTMIQLGSGYPQPSLTRLLIVNLMTS